MSPEESQHADAIVSEIAAMQADLAHLAARAAAGKLGERTFEWMWLVEVLHRRLLTGVPDGRPLG
jgi:hypothetical protein